MSFLSRLFGRRDPDPSPSPVPTPGATPPPDTYVAPAGAAPTAPDPGPSPAPDPAPTAPEAPSVEDDGDEAVGWDAVEAVFTEAYPGQEPQHWGTILSYRLGGNDPLTGVSAYRATEPVPHWHYVTYGYSDLFGEDLEQRRDAGAPVEDPSTFPSGFGTEMTFRLADPAAADPEATAPVWVVSLMQNLARYTFQSRNVIRAGHHLDANGPIALDSGTALTGLTALAFLDDPLHPDTLQTPHGTVDLVNAVGITADELVAVQTGDTRSVLAILAETEGAALTRLGRSGMETDPEIWARVQRTVAEDEGKRTSRALYAQTLRVSEQLGDLVIEFGGSDSQSLFAPLARAAALGQTVVLTAPDVELVTVFGDVRGWEITDGTQVRLTLTPQDAEALAAIDDVHDEHRLPGEPGIVWKHVPES